MSATDPTLERILDLAAEHFGVPRADLSPDDDFFQKLGIDSLKALEMLTRLERHFGIELPDWEIRDVTDFRTLASRVRARL